MSLSEIDRISFVLVGILVSDRIQSGREEDWRMVCTHIDSICDKHFAKISCLICVFLLTRACKAFHFTHSRSFVPLSDFAEQRRNSF